MEKYFTLFFLPAAFFLGGACGGGGQVAQLPEDLDSLYLGFRFGMSPEDFSDRCDLLTREGVLYESDVNQTVVQEIGTFSAGARLYMQPRFDEAGKLYELDMLFQYDVPPGFLPGLTPAKLREETMAFIEQHLGMPLKPKEHPTLKRVWERVDSHRRVRLFHEGQRIRVEYYNLHHQVTG